MEYIASELLKPIKITYKNHFLIGPTFSNQNYQATGSNLGSSAITSQIDTSSSSIDHYVFLAGTDGSGPVGIAWVGSACLRMSSGNFTKMTIK